MVLSNCDGVVLCAFWRVSRSHFGVRVCDNLIGGVPACVIDDFYPDSPTAGGLDDDTVVCGHFVRSDVYFPAVKCGCYFGGVRCVHSDVEGFGACVGCCRFVKS